MSNKRQVIKLEKVQTTKRPLIVFETDHEHKSQAIALARKLGMTLAALTRSALYEKLDKAA
jgi:hypothetical protein